MKRSFQYIILAIIMLSIMQLMFGNIPSDFFRFPLNAMLAVLWIITISKGKSLTKWQFFKTISSSNFSIAIITIFCFSIIILGFVNQDNDIHDSFGFHSFTTSFIFIGLLILFITNLIFITTDYMKSRRDNKIRFFLIHVGLICSLSAGILGSSDQQVFRIIAKTNKESNEMYDSYGNMYKLDYKIKLLKLDKLYYSNGNIAKCCGKFLIDNNKTDIEVNSPYYYNLFEDIYMVSYDKKKSDYCILEIVKQPWKYIMLLGIIMIIIGAFMLFINGPIIKKEEL